MDKTSYVMWRWLIPALLYSVFVTLFISLYTDYWIRFLLIFASRYVLLFNEIIVNAQAKKPTFGPQNKTRGFFKKTLNVLLKSLLLAFSVTSLVTYAMFGEAWSLRLNGMTLEFNLMYFMVYFMLFLLVEIIVDAITAIKA